MRKPTWIFVRRFLSHHYNFLMKYTLVDYIQEFQSKKIELIIREDLTCVLNTFPKEIVSPLNHVKYL